jgi:hypothetical protein
MKLPKIRYARYMWGCLVWILMRALPMMLLVLWEDHVHMWHSMNATRRWLFASTWFATLLTVFTVGLSIYYSAWTWAVLSTFWVVLNIINLKVAYSWYYND